MEQLIVQGHVINTECITHWSNQRIPLISLNLYFYLKKRTGVMPRESCKSSTPSCIWKVLQEQQGSQ